MKQLKLFFALFAMLALNVGNAWGAETVETISYSNHKGKGTSSTGSEHTMNGDKFSITDSKFYCDATKTYAQFYANSTITITPNTGVTIKNIVITASSSSYNGFQSSGTFTPSIGSVTKTDNTHITWAGSATSEFTISHNKQIRWTAIEVTYEETTSGGGENPGEGGGEDPVDPTPGAGGTGTINFNGNAVKINAASVMGQDNLNNTWTITTVGTTSFTSNSAYFQVGSSSKPATSITFTTTLPQEGTVTDFSAKFGGFSNTKGNVTLKVDDTSVGTGSLNGTSDVVVKNSSEATGKTLTVTVTGIERGVKVYYISYTYTTSSGSGSGETVPSLTLDPTSKDFATVMVGEEASQEFTITPKNTTATLSASIDNTTDFAISAITGDKVTVTYQPQSAGDHTATMTVKAGEEASTTVALTGKAKTPLAPIAGGVIDILNQAWTGKTNSTYGDVAEKTAENTGHSNAKYVAQCAGDKFSIQLRSNNNNSGVVSTISGGIVKRVEVEWQNETATGRVLQVYGSNTAYEAATDLYSDDKKGELLGEITMGGDETVVDYSQWTGDYKYIGLRSKSGAMYLTTITITWLPINSKVTIDDAIQNGSISVSGAADLNAVAAGTILTLDNTSDAGYKFVKYNVYKTGEPTTEIDVENSKFTMPEYDVTVSATFTSIKELDKIEVNTTNVKQTFWQGEAFNSNGLEVTAYYTDGTSAEVTPTNITGGNTENAGEITVTVSYTEGSNTKTTTYNIIVKAIENNETTVYTVAQAREIIDAVGNTTVEVYVQGIVSKIVTAFNPTYGNISYDISADGSKTSDQLQAYRGFSYNGDWFTSVDDIQVGDVVVVKGKLKIYNTTYELDEGNQLVKLERSDEPKPTAASLPFEFDGGRDAIATTLGMSQDGLDADYGSSPKLKFNTTGDYVIVHFDSEPGKLSYDIKGNSFEGGTFSVQQSADGSTYTDVVVYTTFDGLSKENDLLSTSRYVKFIYTNKSAGNVALGNIKIALPSEEPEQPGGGETPGERLTEWVLTPLADITTNDLVVITMTKGETTWAMSNDNGTSAAPAAPVVTLSADALAAEPDANLKWVVSNDNGTLTIYPYGTYETWLYCTNTNNGVRVGTGDAKKITLNANYLYTSQTTDPRHIGVYNEQDWRCYKPSSGAIATNIADQTLAFYVKKNANDVLPGTGEDPEEPGDDPVVPTPTVNPTATFIFNTADGLSKLGITYPAADGGSGALMTEFEDGASYTQDGITMTTTNGDTKTRVWQKSGGDLDLRIYKNASLTLSVGKDLVISNVVFTGKGISTLKVDGEAVSNNSWAGHQQSVTFDVTATTNIYTIAITVSYTRSISADYGTICLPYGSSNYSGAEFYEFVGQETGKVWLASVDKLEAGVPYVFKVKGTQLTVAYEGTPVSGPSNHNGLYGTFTDNTPVAPGHYIISQGKVLAPCGTGCYVNANRAYVVMEDIKGDKPTQQIPGRKYIGMDVQGENEATGVEDLFTTDAPVKVIENGQLIIIRDGVKYNVQGQKL